MKANAYGLGAREVVGALVDERCNTFFVATLSEGLDLREDFPTVDIFVFAGLVDGEVDAFRSAGLRPVLNSINQLVCWANKGGDRGAALHIDTAMNRLGVSPNELVRTENWQGLIRQAGVTHLMTHLACADEPLRLENEMQLRFFQSIADQVPDMLTSIGNSAGIYNGKLSCGDLARPGIALYGGNPWSDLPNPTKPVVRLTAPVLQTRTINPGDRVGYGSHFIAKSSMKLATIGIGYADGIPRSLSPDTHVWLGNRRCPLVGRVSMDAIVVDVTSTEETAFSPHVSAEIIGRTPIDTWAQMSGTITNDVLTSIGPRVERVYLF